VTNEGDITNADSAFDSLSPIGLWSRVVPFQRPSYGVVPEWPCDLVRMGSLAARRVHDAASIL